LITDILGVPVLDFFINLDAGKDGGHPQSYKRLFDLLYDK